jgi:hypothetical protein
VEVAAHAGFSDQSQFSRHFKRRRRRAGVIPGARKNRLRRPSWLKLSEPRPLGVSRTAYNFEAAPRPGYSDGGQPITRLNVREKTNGFW